MAKNKRRNLDGLDIPKRAVLYARVSSDDTGKDGRNLDGQLDMCRKFSEGRGYKVIAELAEDERGASGASDDLAQLTKFLDMAAAGEFDILVAREVDRVARDMGKFYRVEKELKRYDVRIEYVLYDFPDTAAGNMMKGIYASFAQFERDTITERNTRGRLLKVRGGSVMMHGAAPYGYRLISGGKKNHRLEICEGEARVLRMIFDWYAWGEEGKALSIGEIVRRLTALGIPTPAEVKGGGTLATKKRGAGVWSRSTVNYFLKSETLAGVWHYAKKTQGKGYPVIVPAIIDPETWAASQARLKGARLETGRKPTHDYLMGRRVRCGACKRYGMAGQHAISHDKLYLYYMCLGRTQHAATKCEALKVRAREVDAVIWSWIRGLLLDPAKIMREIKTLGEQTAEANSPIMARLKDCDDLLANNARESGRLADLYTSGLFSLDDVSEKKHRLDAERESIANERARIAAQLDRQAPTEAQVLTVCAMMEEIAEKLPYADQHFGGRRQLIEALDVHCTVTREAEGVVVYASCIVGKLRLAIPANSIETGRITIRD